MSLTYEFKQKAYFLAYNAARMFGTHEQAHRWGCYARDRWKIADSLNKGYSVGKKFLRVATMFYFEENIDEVLEREGIKHNDTVPPTPPHGSQVPQVSNLEEDDDEDNEDKKKKFYDL